MGNKSGKDQKLKHDHKILTEAQITYLLDKTHYNREEILKWHEGFLMDCPNGLLDQKQFSKIFGSYYPKGKAESFSTQIFNVFDTDRSGSIDFVEFLIALSVSSQSDIRKKLKLAFKYYDIKKNGTIDKEEMYKMITAIYELKGEFELTGENNPEHRVQEIFKHLDKDQNGTLDEDEFINGCIDNPALMKLLVPQALKNNK